MSKDRRIIELGKSYSSAVLDTFNVGSSLLRLHELIDEAELFQELFQKNTHFDSSKLNIFRYASVAAATCLEWHARSRLADMLTYSPESITEGDVRNVKLDKLGTMAKEGVTVAGWIAANTNISSSEQYLSVFSRLFELIGEKESPKKLLVGILFDGIEKGGENKLEVLFGDRNRLVHEINVTEVGSYVLRDYAAPKDAIANLSFALDLILEIEKVISELAPRNFPNLLDETLSPISVAEANERQAGLLEIEILENIAPEYEQHLANVLMESNRAYEREKEFLHHNNQLRPVRHIDYREYVAGALAKSRYQYLAALKECLMQVDDSDDKQK